MPATRAWIPNSLSIARILAAPLMLFAAATSRAALFWLLLLLSLASDLLDGWLARKLKAESDHGRLLDSWGDYVNFIAVPVSLTLLWPGTTRREAPWLALAIGTFFAHTAYAWLRYRIVPAYHTWGSKSIGALLALTVIVVYAGGPSWPFHAAAIMEVFVALDEFAIGAMLPGWSGSMPSSWHARRVHVAHRVSGIQAGRAPSAERRGPQ
jgi:CDP-diacylglycerol--glycerol-3-phosphate 3-phosphatidyltransferase